MKGVAVFRLRGGERDYAWGSTRAIPELMGREPDGHPLAELWFGAHRSAPTELVDHPGTTLDQQIAAGPQEALGADVVARFGPHLPYLLKLIAPARPLSLQVHPDLAQARAGFAAEEASGINPEAPERLYRDANHKPELLYALTPFAALSGFRTPRRALELLSSLNTALSDRLAATLRADPTSTGVQAAVTELLTPGAIDAQEVLAVVDACGQRAGARRGSVRIDRIVSELGEAYPGDPGAVCALLLNPVSLRPGEAMFIPTGTPHAYLQGLGVEVMANSDNVLRAGLTSKHIDTDAVLGTMDYVAAPPVRIAPEITGATRIFYAPVEDFEMSVTSVDGTEIAVPGHGPRIALSVSGQARVRTEGTDSVLVGPGQAVFVPAPAGPVIAGGEATLVQTAVP